MPLPMVHMLLAKKIEEKSQQRHNDYFLLGSIAPDSIHTRPGTNRADKHRTHMFESGHGTEYTIKRNRQCVKNVIEEFRHHDENYREFVKGYCIHTILDIMWINKIFNVLESTLRSGGLNFNDIRTIYYHETNICDGIIYNCSSWASEYKNVLKDIDPVGFKDILTKDEVGLWRDGIVSKMDKYENFSGEEKCFYKSNVPIGQDICLGEPHYITYEVILKFINEFIDSLCNYFPGEV